MRSYVRPVNAAPCRLLRRSAARYRADLAGRLDQATNGLLNPKRGRRTPNEQQSFLTMRSKAFVSPHPSAARLQSQSGRRSVRLGAISAQAGVGLRNLNELPSFFRKFLISAMCHHRRVGSGRRGGSSGRLGNSTSGDGCDRHDGAVWQGMMEFTSGKLSDSGSCLSNRALSR